MSDYYTITGDPAAQSRGASSVIRSVIAAISAGFDKLPTLAQVWGEKANYAVDTGVANAYLASIAPTYLTSYTDGMTIKVKAINANTAASTINVNALGVRSIVRPDGTALQASDITAGQIVTLTYTTTAGNFRMGNAYGGPIGPTPTTMPWSSLTGSPTTIAATGDISTSGGTLGYATGVGGTVTQGVSKSTAVTLNKITGAITMNNASLGADTAVAFTVNNSLVTVNDIPVIALANTFASTLAYTLTVENVTNGTFVVQVRNNSVGALGEALRINFAIIKGAVA